MVRKVVWQVRKVVRKASDLVRKSVRKASDLVRKVVWKPVFKGPDLVRKSQESVDFRVISCRRVTWPFPEISDLCTPPHETVIF